VSGEPIRLDRWTVTSGSNAVSRAAVVLHAGSHDWKASADGTGAVDALYRAVDEALASVLGGSPRLLAYDVHALGDGPDAEGKVTVRVAPPADAGEGRADGLFDAASSSVNTLAASVEAYVSALNAMLATDAWAGAADEAASAHRPAQLPGHHAASSGTVLDDEAQPIDTTEWFNR
jgi:2-isopropylmalate synthase